MNCTPSTPWHKGCRSYFPYDVQAPVDIGVDERAELRTEQSAFDAPACIRLVFADRFMIEKATFARVAFLGDVNLDAYQFGFVGQHLDKSGMRHTHKILISALAHVGFLLPFRIFANHQMPDALTHQEINNAT